MSYALMCVRVSHGRDPNGLSNLLRNLVTDKVNSSGIVSNSGEREEQVAAIAKANIPQEDTSLARFKLLVIYGSNFAHKYVTRV